MKKFQGIGYQEYKDMRVVNEGIPSGKLEKSGNERYLVYFGRYHITDHETGVTCRGPLKIGRGKFATALMRGRNQPGGDFRIYGEIVFTSNRATELVEELIKENFHHRNIKMRQGQRELYDISDNEIEEIISEIVDAVNEHRYYSHQCNITEVNLYEKIEGKKLKDVSPKNNDISTFFEIV